MHSKIRILAAVSLLALPIIVNAETELKSDKEKISYSIGTQLGQDIKRNEIDLDMDMFVRAMRDALAGNKPAMSEDEMRATMQTFQQNIRQKQIAAAQELGERNKKEGEEFLAANKAKEGVVTLPSGVQYKVITAGTGKVKPTMKDTVVAHYVGTLINGKEFDSSVRRGAPATFPLEGVIKGWQEVLPLMTAGAKWQVVIPPEMAYGARGAGQEIGPNQTLVFEIELLEIQKANVPPKAEGKKTPKDAAKGAGKKPVAPANKAPATTGN